MDRPRVNPNLPKQTVGDMLLEAWNNSRLKKEVMYQIDPERELGPNQRLAPGPMEQFKYAPRPGERVESWDDGDYAFGPDGQQLEFVPPPALRTVADYLGYMVGGAAGAPAGAAGAGIYRRVFDHGPSLLREDPTAVADLAQKMQAMHKRGAQGYELPSFASKDLAKAEKALTRVSNADPLPAYVDRAERAMDMGFDTPAFHVTNTSADPEVLRKLSGAPWREVDPTIKPRGAFYLADFEHPTAPITTGAAQGLYGGAKVYPFLVKDVFGEHPMPPGLFQQMPETIGKAPWGGIADNSIAEIEAAMRGTHGYMDNMAGAREGAQEFFGNNFSDAYFKQSQNEARKTVADLLANTYYKPVQGGDPKVLQRIDPFEFTPLDPLDSTVPTYGAFESGAYSNKGSFQSGLHSPIQNELGSVGFAGSRVFDEMRKAGGKSFAMFDPTGVRAVGAKFKDPMGDLLSGQAPPGWWLQALGQQQQEQPK